MARIFFVLLLIVLVGLGLLVWWDTQRVEYPLQAIVVDKTVPEPTYREHRDLMLIWNAMGYRNPKTEEKFNWEKDYIGFFPKYTETEKYFNITYLPDPIPKTIDLVYVADIYGVYSREFYGPNWRGERSARIYGGLELEEINIMEKKAREDGILMIGEFNMFASPTESGPRSVAEKMFGVQWTEWVGRFFRDLSRDNVEVPIWMIRNYEGQTGKKWEFDGPGIGFVHLSDEVVILPFPGDLSKQGAFIEFNGNPFPEIDQEKPLPYEYWFDILTVDEDVEVLADFTLPVTESGQYQLDLNNIPNRFPAIIRTKYHDSTLYYFAGDFIDSDPSLTFFTDFYYPLIKQIMMDHFPLEKKPLPGWAAWAQPIRNMISPLSQMLRDEDVKNELKAAGRKIAMKEALEREREAQEEAGYREKELENLYDDPDNEPTAQETFEYAN